jgi:hypothetical protein
MGPGETAQEGPKRLGFGMSWFLAEIYVQVRLMLVINTFMENKTIMWQCKSTKKTHVNVPEENVNLRNWA